MARVELANVARRYGRTVAIEDISFRVPDGEFWVLVGPSGCGKSTILRAIAGLETVSAGQIYLGDRLVTALPARQRDVAMVFQNYALYPHMTVAQNLAFGLRMRQAGADAEIARRVEDVARSLDIAHLLERKPKQLSGGQQQRVALGRAIARSPQAFLLDEPLSNLDAQLRDATRTELKRLHHKLGITTLYVTHDQTEAMTLAQRLVVLDRGRIQQIGTPQEVYEQPANRTVAAFVGTPAMNLLRAHYDGETFRVGEHRIPSTRAIALSPGTVCEVGIRAEHVQVTAAPESATLPLEVEVVEPLGRETAVTGRVAGTKQTLSVLVPGTWSGTALTVSLPLSALYVFDGETGSCLHPARART